MKRVHLIGSLALVAGFALMALLSRSRDIAVLYPAGPVAAGELHVILLTFALASLVVVPVFALLFYFAWRYHASGPDVHVHHDPDWDHDNPWFEFSWWLPPAVIVGILAIIAWQSSHALDPYVPLPGKPVEVQVIALQWKWLFIYPQEEVASLNELVIPAGRPVHFSLTARAPMNSFWIPSLGGQIMVMPGMQTQLYLQADKPGVFDGYSGNISGKGFADMHFKVRSLSDADFRQWAQGAHASPPLDVGTFNVLAQPGGDGTSRTYSAVEPDLYTSTYIHYITSQGEMQMP